MKHLPSEKRTREYVLDLHRIMAASSIVFFHYTFRGYAADNLCIVKFPLMAQIFKYGYMGFYLFFILSGYLISISIEKKNLLDFLIARIARIYPAFWVCVVLTSIAVISIEGNRYSISLFEFLANLTMLNKLVGIKPIDGTYWFLYVLMKLYLLMSLFIIIRKNISIQVFVIVILLLDLFDYHYNLPKISFVIESEYSPFFMAGVICYLVKKSDGGRKVINLLLLMMCFIFCFEIVIDKSYRMETHYQTVFSHLVIGIILFMIFALFIISINTELNLRSKWLMKFGMATYPLYLLHENIGFMIFNKCSDSVNKYFLLIMVFVLMWILAFIVSLYIEPFLYDKLKGWLYYCKQRLI